MVEKKKVENTTQEEKEERKKIDPNVEINTADFAQAMGDVMERIIKMSVPANLADRVQRLIDEHESNIVEHPDEYAVLDISTSSLQSTDCIPGYVDIPRRPAEFTNGGLMVKDRYRVKINFVPVGEELHEWTIVNKKKWDEEKGKRKGEMMGNEQQIAAMILRTGGAI